MVPAIYSQCFCGLFSLGQMVSSQKKAQYDMSKTTFGTQGQNAKKRERVARENSLFWCKSYNFFQGSTSLWEILKFSVQLTNKVIRLFECF